MIRLPLVLSLLIAFGFLGVAAAAAPPAIAQTDRQPTLAEQATVQFDLAFRGNPNEGQARMQRLEAVVAAWRAASRTDANNERLSNWLRAAIRASMPGSHDELPAAPTFADNAGREKQPTVKTAPANAHSPEPTIAAPAANSTHDAQNDPFQDDPAEKQAMK
ncbi:MAG TPA: hypothetical protein VH107_17625 [Lacipirellulaceae bacterium]|jgi:hypothetical protein|nr:hypothetical protein [Lacipirellulaceae bacterium]